MTDGHKNLPAPSEKPKPLTGRITHFEKIWLEDINKRINRGEKADMIRKYLSENYKGPINPLPNRKTFAQYIAAYNKLHGDNNKKKDDLKQDIIHTTTELNNMMNRLQLATMPIKDRKFMMESTIRFMLIRIQKISDVQESILDPRFEQAIGKHFSEIDKLLDKLIKGESEFKIHEFIARRIIEKFFLELALVVRRCAEDTWGKEKTKEFLDRLQKGYKAIDFDRIREEAIEESNAYQRGETDGKKTRSNAA